MNFLPSFRSANPPSSWHAIRTSASPASAQRRLHGLIRTHRPLPAATTWSSTIPTKSRNPFRSLSTSTKSLSASGGDDQSALKALSIRQRKAGTWLPKWQTLTLSTDHDSKTCSFQSTPGSDKAAAGAGESSTTATETKTETDIDAAKHLLSPQTALAVFLPKGFPESVTPNYWPFAKWQFVHNVAGSVTAGKETSKVNTTVGRFLSHYHTQTNVGGHKDRSDLDSHFFFLLFPNHDSDIDPIALVCDGPRSRIYTHGSGPQLDHQGWIGTAGRCHLCVLCERQV